MSANDACAKARKAIQTREFVGWQGFPPHCTASDLFANLPHLPSDPADRPVRPLGENFQRAVFQVLDLPGYYRPTVSFRDDALVMFDAMNPDLALGFAPLEADLGAPAARLDWYYGTLEMPGGEWVFPARGITVFLNSTFDRALHLALYHPTSLATYLADLRPHLRKHVRPIPPSKLP